MLQEQCERGADMMEQHGGLAMQGPSWGVVMVTGCCLCSRCELSVQFTTVKLRRVA
jgi:hypothetical protein